MFSGQVEFREFDFQPKDFDGTKGFTDTEIVLSCSEEAERQVLVLRNLVSENISNEEKNHANMLLCESFALNCKLLEVLQEVMLYGEPGSNYGEDKADQIVMNNETASFMENIMMARLYTTSELTLMNISTQIH